MATVDRPGLEAIEEDELPNGVVRPTGPMTEEEFVAWCDEDIKAEWVDGEVIVMGTSNYRHVRLVNWLIRVMGLHASARGLGEVLGPEFMVRFGPTRRRRVPDVLFVAKERQHLIRENHLEGAPDLAVEVVSPDSQSRDRRDKYLDYQAAGVREYWIVDPANEDLDVHVLDAQGHYQEIPLVEGRVSSEILAGFFLRPEWLWQVPPPDEWATLQILGFPG